MAIITAKERESIFNNIESDIVLIPSVNSNSPK